jgi:hypothetical protein
MPRRVDAVSPPWRKRNAKRHHALPSKIAGASPTPHQHLTNTSQTPRKQITQQLNL